MNNKKNMLLGIIAIVTLLVLIVGATYAYFTAQTGSGAGADVNVTTSTTDNLTFNTEGEITIHATPENFSKDGSSLSDSAKATATLRANNATNSATNNYYVYLNIFENDFGYTTEAETAELILTITDPNGNAVTELEGYDYVTVNGVSGFDITKANGLITLADNYEIATTDTTTQEWNVELTFVNLDSDQNENTGKIFGAVLLIQKGAYTLANYIVSQYGTVPTLYYHDENLEGGANDLSYRYSGGAYYSIMPEYTDEYSDIDNLVKWYCELPDVTEVQQTVDQLKDQYPDVEVFADENTEGGNCYTEVYLSYFGETIFENLYGTGYWYLDYNESAHFESREEAISQAKDNGYIYTVDNYVCFGSDAETCPEDNLYRILGVFSNRVKLIKNKDASSELLGTDGGYDNGVYAWGDSSWSESSLNTINLNTNYLNNIGSKWSDMIALSRWSVGGMKQELSESTSPKVVYDAEMTYDIEYSAKIGLQYVSDSRYAMFLVSSGDSWLATPSCTPEYSISKVTDSEYPAVFSGAYGSGIINLDSIHYMECGLLVRPTFYLLESIEYKGGTGSSIDPIRIG